MKRVLGRWPALGGRVDRVGKMGVLVGAVAVLACSTIVWADDSPILMLGDYILAIDEDIVSQSSYPTSGNDERPTMILDGNVNTKYLNFGKERSGFIVTPTRGSSTVRSMVLSTANDAEERDPASYEIYGTNDPILSTNNSDGNGGESWTLIASAVFTTENGLALPAARLAVGPVIVIANDTAYTSYKVLFPTVKNAAAANSMQIAEVAMYETSDGSGTNVLSEGGTVLAIDVEGDGWYPVPAENPQNILDGRTDTKYLNFGEERSGFIVTPSYGSSTIQSMVVYTANDYEERDPTSYELYGTNQPIASTDNSAGEAESWTPIASGDFTLPATRRVAGPVISFTNATAYTSYKVLFPTVKNAATANSMQISEVKMYLTDNGTGTNILSSGGTVLAVDPDGMPESAYTADQKPPYAVDGDALNKYVNAGELNSGFIVTPSAGLSIATAFKITTADTAPESDPTSWTLYGTTDPITSANNSTGNLENWTLIASGAVALPDDRHTEGPVVSFTNTTAYSSYRMVFPTVKDRTLSVALQIGEIQFYGTVVNPLPAQLLTPGDPIIAFDLDADTGYSEYPAAEAPANILDGNTGTKYLNFGAVNSGFIVKPAAGSSIVKSMRLSTANDATERDPASYELYGTNETIVSTDNSWGTAETWTLIASGAVSLPDARLDTTTVVAFAGNSTAYAAYKVVFPALKNAGMANSMQIADVALYTSSDGSGTSVLAPGDTVLAIDADVVPPSSYPATQGPANAIDRLITTKYLNFGANNAGFIVTPSIGSSVVSAFRFVTADDSDGYPQRDPADWALYGTNDPVISPDNGHGNLEDWTLIASGTMTLPNLPQVAGPIVAVDNITDYTAYRMVITGVRNAGTADSFQFAEVQFFGLIGVACATPFADLDGDTDVDQVDFGLFQSCFTGLSTPATSRMCKCVDRNKDTFVDVMDLTQFINCLTGPAVPWKQELTPSCVP